MTSAGRDDDAVFEIRGSYLEERPYTDTFERDGLTMTFASQHRSLERVARAILDAGLLIDHVAEVEDSTDPPGSPGAGSRPSSTSAA